MRPEIRISKVKLSGNTESIMSINEKALMCVSTPQSPVLPYKVYMIENYKGGFEKVYSIPVEDIIKIVNSLTAFRYDIKSDTEMHDLHSDKRFNADQLLIIRYAGRNLIVSPLYLQHGGMLPDIHIVDREEKTLKVMSQDPNGKEYGVCGATFSYGLAIQDLKSDFRLNITDKHRCIQLPDDWHVDDYDVSNIEDLMEFEEQDSGVPENAQLIVETIRCLLRGGYTGLHFGRLCLASFLKEAADELMDDPDEVARLKELAARYSELVNEVDKDAEFDPSTELCSVASDISILLGHTMWIYYEPKA